MDCAKGCGRPLTIARNSRPRPDGRWEHVYCPDAVSRIYGRGITQRTGRFSIKDPGLCPCECNSGGRCYGCGHAGCGNRNR